jgi:hypothetical protein
LRNAPLAMLRREMVTTEHEARQHAFVVRLWKEPLGGGSEYRGSVRDLATDAFRSFRDWSDLVAFMVARVEQEELARTEGGT